MSEKLRRRRFQFGLKWLLITMTLVAIYLVGRWNGYQDGRKDAFSEDWLMLTVRNEPTK